MTCKDCIFYAQCVAAGYGDDEATDVELCCRGFRQVKSAAESVPVSTAED